MALIRKILAVVLILLSYAAQAQDKASLPHSVIHFIRPIGLKSLKSFINLPNQAPFEIGPKSIVNFTIYSTGRMPIILQFTYAGDVKEEQVVIDIESGKEYNITCFRKFELIDDKSAADYMKELAQNVTNYEEDLNSPINKGSISLDNGPKQGSGFLVNKDGYVITNFHVIDGAKKITIKGIKGDYSTAVEAKVISIDAQNDLALLKIDSKLITFDTPPYVISSSKDVQQGQNVFAMGYPIQDVMGSEVKVTSGIISAKSGYKGSISEFQFSASVQPGNSGGPLFDQNGEVIGIVYAKISAEGVEAVGYAIKSDYLKFFLDQVGNIQYNTQSQLAGKSLSEEVSQISPFVYIINAE